MDMALSKLREMMKNRETWLQSPLAVISEPKKRKSVTTSTFSPSICHEVS